MLCCITNFINLTHYVFVVRDLPARGNIDELQHDVRLVVDVEENGATNKNMPFYWFLEFSAVPDVPTDQNHSVDKRNNEGPN